MRFVVCGKSFIAVNSLNYLHSARRVYNLNFEIVALLTKNDVLRPMDTWEPSLFRAAQQLGVEAFSCDRAIKLTQDDVLLSLQYDRIFITERLNGARAYNVHFSKLPKYRGCYPSVLPLRNGEKQAGVTLHVITDGIDDGPIVDQRVFDIPEYYTSYDLYRAYNAHGFEMVKKNLPDIISGEVVAVEQNHRAATYFSRDTVDFKDIVISDFDAPAEKVRDWIRSLMFKPYQMPVYRGKNIMSVDVLKTSEWGRLGEPFEDEHVAVVECEDGFVRLGLAPC